MARQRDYAAEYRRRIERAKQKAREQGTPFDRSKARGHGSRYEENLRRRMRRLIYKLADENRRDGVDYTEHGDVYGVINDALRDGVEFTRMVSWLKDQQESLAAYALHDAKPGRRKYRRATAKERRELGRKWIPRRRDIGEALFYYHGNY